MMQRHPDWPERFRRALDARRRLPFAWGTNDCATFAADVIAAMTGVDFAEGLRGQYASREEADALLEERGWGDVEGLADAFLPRLEGRPRRGDVVMLQGLEGRYLAVCLGGDIAMAPDLDRGKIRHIDKHPGGLLAAWGVA